MSIVNKPTKILSSFRAQLQASAGHLIALLKELPLLNIGEVVL